MTPPANRPLRPAPAPSTARRVALPLLLSLLIPGLGQLYNGQKAKGFAILAVVAVVVAAQLYAMTTGDLALNALASAVGLVVLSLVGLAAAADAGFRAAKR